MVAMPLEPVIAAMWEDQRPAALDVVRAEPADDELERKLVAAFDPDLSDEQDAELREALADDHVRGAREAARKADVDWDDDTRETAEQRARMAANVEAPELLRQLRDSSAALAAKHVISQRAAGADVDEQVDSLGALIDGWREY